jgi:hypothetical protein
LKIPGNVLNSVINKDSANKSPLVKGAVSQAASAKSAQAAVKNVVKAPAQTTAIFDKNSLVSQLKLPQDALSRSLVTFARLFSLPLETSLLSALRREALNAAQKAASGGLAALTPSDAAAMAAAAAASKDITMTESALAEYAAAIEGRLESFTQQETARHAEKSHANRDSGTPQDKAENKGFAQDDGSPAERGESEGGGSFHDGRGNSGFKDTHGGKRGVKTQLSDVELQDRITTILQEKPLLDLINRIPCKNGRWIVIPFSFYDNSFKIDVSLRIFLYEGVSKTGGNLILERLDADIKVNPPEKCPGQEQKRWLISLKKSEGDFWAECGVFSGSEPWNFSTAEKKRVRQELAAALGLPLNKVSIKKGNLFSTESDEIILESVNEAV